MKLSFLPDGYWYIEQDGERRLIARRQVHQLLSRLANETQGREHMILSEFWDLGEPAEPKEQRPDLLPALAQAAESVAREFALDAGFELSQTDFHYFMRTVLRTFAMVVQRAGLGVYAGASRREGEDG